MTFTGLKYNYSLSSATLSIPLLSNHDYCLSRYIQHRLYGLCDIWSMHLEQNGSDFKPNLARPTPSCSAALKPLPQILISTLYVTTTPLSPFDMPYSFTSDVAKQAARHISHPSLTHRASGLAYIIPLQPYVASDYEGRNGIPARQSIF